MILIKYNALKETWTPTKIMKFKKCKGRLKAAPNCLCKHMLHLSLLKPWLTLVSNKQSEQKLKLSMF